MSLNPKEYLSTPLTITDVHSYSSLSSTIVPPPDIVRMQVARKENSSGFMLLSVKHQTKKNKSTHSGMLINQKTDQFDDFYGNSCVGKASSLLDMNCRGGKRNSYEFGKHFESTASLDAEEYDDEEGEDEFDANSEPHDMVLTNEGKSPEMAKTSNIMPLQTNMFNLADVKHSNDIRNGHINATQSDDSVPLVSAVNIHAGVGEIRQHILVDGLVPVATQSSCNINEMNGAENMLPFPHFQQNDTTVTAMKLQPETSTDQSNDVFCSTCIDKHVIPACSTNLQKINNFNSRVDGFKSPDICVNSLVPTNPTKKLPINPSMQSIRQIEQIKSASDILNISSQIFPPIQTASRFRKARIRETVEQWNSNRVSFHDCRLKAVPDWVSDLQAKSSSNVFNHPITQRSRCLYCFVPGSYGQQCESKHHHKSLRPINYNSVILQNSKESISVGLLSVTGVLQAADAAYQASLLQRFNVDSLLSSWNAGHRSSYIISPEQMNLYGLSKHPFKSRVKLGDIEHQPGHIIEQHYAIPDTILTDDAISYAVGHNSSELTDVMEPVFNFNSGHDFETSLILSKSVGAEFPQTESNNAEEHNFKDPSTAYLRRIVDSVRQDPTSSNERHFANENGMNYYIADGAQSNEIINQNYNSEGQFEIEEKQILSGQLYVPPTSPTFATFQMQSPSEDSWFPGRQDSNLPKDTTPFLDINTLLCNGDTLRRRAAAAGVAGIVDLFASLATSSPQSPGVEMQAASSNPTDMPPTTSTHDTSTGTLNIRKCSVSSMDTMQTMQMLPRCNSGMDASVTANGCSNIIYANGERASSMGPSSTNPDYPDHNSVLTAASEVGVSERPEVFPPLTGPRHQSLAPLTDVLEARMPNSMDMIRLAIMTTFKEEVSQLSTENRALREGIQNLHCENLMLRGYQRAFQALQPYVPPEIWEQLEVQVQLEACQQYQQSQQPQQQIPVQTQQPIVSLMQNGCRPTTSIGIVPPNHNSPLPNPLAHVDLSTRHSPVSRISQIEPPNNIAPVEIPPIPNLCANIQPAMLQHKDN